jgi:putative ABC transport system permease protein
MNVLRRIRAIFVVSLKRLYAQRWLALATSLGLVVVVALAVSVPLYADATYYRVLRQELATGGSGGRPPFAFMFRYVGAWFGTVEWEDVRPVDAYVSARAAAVLGLPQRSLVRYVETDNFKFFPAQDAAYADIRDPLGRVTLGSASDLRDHITVLEGRFPAPAIPSPDSTLEVLISEAYATELGVQVGEAYLLFATRETEGAKRSIQMPVRIAGVWRPTEAADPYWFYSPSALDQVLLVPEATFLNRVSPYLEGEVELALWYLILDGSEVHAGDVDALLGRINAARQQVAALLPETKLSVSPAPALEQYRRSTRVLTLLLYAFSVPIVALILGFMALVAGLSVERQRNEIAVWRSRGATVVQVVGIAALEGAVLGMLALLVGLPAGDATARIIGRARSFLDFTLQTNLRVGLTVGTLRFGLMALGLALLVQVVPTIGAARHTIVSYKQERARRLGAPWWQRAWLDLLLLIPASYGLYVLRQQGSVALPMVEGLTADPFQNPLLLLVPALGVFALTLFVLRVLPLLMSGVVWIISQTRAVGMLIAARHLARTPGFYSAPLLLLILTLSLSTFTASLAWTMDAHMDDRAYYEVGADLRLNELGQSTEPGGGPRAGLAGLAPAPEEEGELRWLFLPVSEHLKVPGVKAAARVGRYEATANVAGLRRGGTFIGVDRLDFPKVAFWRQDFAPASLGGLMNGLAVYPEGVLVPRPFMARHGLSAGDHFRVTVYLSGEAHDLDLRIVGGFDLFPTWFPEEGPLFVGNLNHLFERVGGQHPYHVWLATGPGADDETIVEGVRDLGLAVLGWKAAALQIAEEQRRPERQGLFGLLSVGFLAAAVLTAVGFLLYAFFSFRRRFIELGVLRAIGLSARQMTSFLTWELAFLLLTGVVAGTGLGIAVSRLFIPYLQVGTGPSAQIPPFVVDIAWPAIFRVYALFGLLFLAALGGLVILLRRMEIFRAVKLGEAA